MEDKKQGQQGNGWMSVPAFGDWDMKNGLPDYSLDFSKIREKRKQNKRDISRSSLGNEDDLAPSQDHHHPQSQSQDQHHERPRTPSNDLHRPHHLHHRGNSPTGRKKFMSYFHCCIGA